MIWTNVTVKLGDLQPWEHNPRTMSKTQAKRLIKSWQTLGQFQTIAIGPAHEVYDGHQRLNALLAAYGAAYEVEARQSERALNDDERAALTLAANIPAGSWDWQALAQWDAEAIKDWGMDAETLATWNSDAANLATMLGENETEDEDNEYSTKVSTPIYEIKGDNPNLSELFDDEKFTELIGRIDSSELPEDVKLFLRAAATRHIVFNFSKIAEYYAHANKPLQKLMEDSALVIIDFDRAIELGYVRLSEKIAEQFSKEYPYEQ
jgi:hypothetical protein